jgi:hypothetical protein
MTLNDDEFEAEFNDIEMSVDIESQSNEDNCVEKDVLAATSIAEADDDEDDYKDDKNDKDFNLAHKKRSAVTGVTISRKKRKN